MKTSAAEHTRETPPVPPNPTPYWRRVIRVIWQDIKPIAVILTITAMVVGSVLAICFSLAQLPIWAEFEPLDTRMGMSFCLAVVVALVVAFACLVIARIYCGFRSWFRSIKERA